MYTKITCFTDVVFTCFLPLLHRCCLCSKIDVPHVHLPIQRY
nr:MAG TPA: hypothetical protein [Caudoviricetes sp.]